MYTIASDKEFVELLKEQENTKSSLVRYPTGWTGDGWVKYPSREKGAPTIGYGHKLNPGQTTFDVKDKDGNIIRTIDMLTEKITDQEAHDLLIQDIISHEKKAEAEWTKHRPINGTAWSDLDPTYKGMLTEITFNIGTLENKARTKWGWYGLTRAIKAGNVETALKEISRMSDGKQLGRVKHFQKLWRPRLHKIVADLHPDGGKGKKSNPQVQKMLKIFPSFDQLNRGTQKQLLLKMMKLDIEEANAKKEEERGQQTYMKLMEQESNGRDRKVREALEGKQREEDEATLQREVQEELASREEQTLAQFDQRLQAVERVDETDKVITEQLADVQYFVGGDGKVVKADSKGNILDD